MKMWISLLVLSCFLFNNLIAQEEVLLEGIVLDSISQEALVAVNIFDLESNSGTFSEIDGRFKIKLSQLPATLIFSFIGYENYRLQVSESQEKIITIKLKQSSLNLAAIEVIANPKVEKITEAAFTIKDFIIEDDRVLLIKHGNLGSGNKLELRDLDGNVLHSLAIKSKGVFDKMHQSCLGNIHLLGKKEVIEVEVKSGTIKMISKYLRHEFDTFLKPCIESSEDFVYYQHARSRGQQIKYNFISKKDRIIEESIHVTDEESIARMYEELRDFERSVDHFAANKSYIRPIYSSVLETPRPEEFDAWVGVFFKPIFSPLYNTGEELCLFNHTLGFLRFYTFDGGFKRQFPITYHKEKRWDKKILKDKKTKNFTPSIKVILVSNFTRLM